MAASSYGNDSYQPDKKKKVKKGRTYGEKLAARTTESSRERFKKNNPRGGGGGDSNGPPRPAPVDPLQTRADALTKLRYGGAESELNQRGASIAPWFQNYQNDITAAQTQAQNYAAPIVQQSQDRAKEAGQVATGVDPNSEAGKEATLAAAARAALEGSFTTMLQGYGQVQNDFMAGRKTVGATAEVGEQTRLSRDRAALKADKGLYNATTVEDLRDKKHTQDLENAAYGLKVEETAAGIQNDRRDDRSKANTPNQYGYTAKQWNAMTPEQRRKIMAAVKAEGRPAPKGKTPGADFTPLQRRETQANVRRGVNLLKTKLAGKTTAPAAFWEQAYSALVNEGGPGLKPMDPLLARAVIQIARQGKAGPKIAQRILRDYGLKKLPKGKPLAVPDPYVLPTNGAPTESGQYPH